MKRERPATAMEVAVRNGGMRQAVQCLYWILDFGVCEAMGDFAGAVTLTDRVEAVMARRGYSLSKAWRMQRAFAKCLPMFQTPAELIALPPNVELRRFLQGMASLGDSLQERPSLAKGMASASGARVAV